MTKKNHVKVEMVSATTSSHECSLALPGDVDMYGYLIMTCKFTFQPNENVYIDAVVNISIQKHAVRKVCSIDRWKTWKNMLIYRP